MIAVVGKKEDGERVEDNKHVFIHGGGRVLGFWVLFIFLNGQVVGKFQFSNPSKTQI